jgi:DNA invertase Pin-like site-specific DNA recombinase
MKGYIYARESSADTTNAPSIKGQIAIGRKTIESLGHTLIAVFEDEGKSGADWERSGLSKLRTAVSYGGSDFVWVFAQDRFARDTELFLNLMRTFKEKGIKVFQGSSFTEISMEKSTDAFLHSIIASSDTLFRQATGDKVKATYQHKKKEALEAGKKLRWGRRSAPQALIDMCLKLKKKHPENGCRIIARLLPPYQLALRKGEDSPRMQFVSHAWVANVLKKYYKPVEEAMPTNPTTCEPVKE